jgi:hypothetical protein
LLLLIPIGITFAFGEVYDFSTDKSLYHKSDQLTVSGTISYDPDVPFATIQIFTPGKSNFADFNTVPVNSDGSFSSIFHVGGPTWAADGIYPIKVTYAGSLEKFVEYKKFSEITTPSDPEPPVSTTPESEPESVVVLDSMSNFTTLKFKVPNFPSLDKPPQYYVDRYDNEPSYKTWFDSQFPNDPIDDVVGYRLTHVDNFPSLDKPPQYYVDRYDNEPSYKTWFDSQFPNHSIYNILGYEDPIAMPDWIRNNAEWWAIGEITDSEFVSGIEFMLENNIIMISNVPLSGSVSTEEIPIWIRNNAHWWSQNLISEDEFVNSLKFLIQEGVIIIN